MKKIIQISTSCDGEVFCLTEDGKVYTFIKVKTIRQPDPLNADTRTVESKKCWVEL